MDRTYDLFEVVEGELVWRSAIVGHENAIRALQQVAKPDTESVARSLHERATEARGPNLSQSGARFDRHQILHRGFQSSSFGAVPRFSRTFYFLESSSDCGLGRLNGGY